MPAASVTQRFLALWFPHLPVERHRRQGCAWPADAPAALVARSGNLLRLVSVDPRAAALGLVPGMPLADARAQFPGLCVGDADPVADAALLGRIARRMYRFTPTVMRDPPDGLLLEIGSSAHLFGGEQEVAQRLAATFAARDLSVRQGLAGNPDAARAFARFGRCEADEQAAIRALPVQALGLEEDATRALGKLGLKRIGDLAARPGAGLAARFGSGALMALARILGEAPTPIVPDSPASRLFWTRRLAEPILGTEQAILVLEQLVQGACRRLERLHAGGQCFEAVFHRTDGIDRTVRVACGRPLRNAKRIMHLFHERLDALRDPIDPGFGFDCLHLAVVEAAPLGPEAVTLEEAVDRPADRNGLVDSLRARLGEGRVHCFQPRDTHVPERAAVEIEAGQAGPCVDWSPPPPGEPPRRPVLLFDPPHRVEVLAEVPDGPPLRFRWKTRLHLVRLAEGPERIAGEWWRHAPGRPAATRDYYRVEDCDGRRFWLFRNGLYSETTAPDWYLHGMFA